MNVFLMSEVPLYTDASPVRKNFFEGRLVGVFLNQYHKADFVRKSS